MRNKFNSMADSLEPFLLGMSCLVGGDNFSLLLSHTTISAKIQYFLFISIAIVSIIISAVIDAHYMFNALTPLIIFFFIVFYTFGDATGPVFAFVMSVMFLTMLVLRPNTGMTFHLLHWYYCVFSGILVVFVHMRISSMASTVSIVIGIGYIMTFLIVTSCSYYSTSRTNILTFIFGIFGSRFLPSLFWILSNIKDDYDMKVNQIAKRLVSSRFAFCFISMFLKLYMGKLTYRFRWDITEILRGINSLGNFNELSRIMEPLVDTSGIVKVMTAYFDYLIPFFNVIPFISFLSSVVLYLILPPSINLIKSDYSPMIVSRLTNIKMIFHLIGSVLGIAYPASVTGNSYIFYSIIFFVYMMSIVLWFILYYAGRYLSINILYIDCILSGIAIGYMWAYCLGIVVNTILRQTCKYDEIQKGFRYVNMNKNPTIKAKPCCGNKITNYCYCRYPSIIKDLKEGEEDMIFRCSKLTCNDNKNKNLKYSREGKKGVLICVPGSKDSLSKCEMACQDCKNGCCVKIVGVYDLESVTTSSCQDCQLVIRLEGSCSSGNGKCNVCAPGGTCMCPNVNGKCCCICTKCCNGSDTCSGCCCLKPCNGTGRSCSCNCNSTSNSNELGTRVFIAYPSGINNYSIKEIKPNNVDNFDGDFSNHNEFDILDIFISDCCHSNLRLDLHCGMKNNMFRLTGMNYPKKSDASVSLVLKYVISKCCKKGNSNCCCPYRDLVRAYIKYDDSKCSSEPVNGPCTGSDTIVCAKYCTLTVDQEDSFTKKVDKIRIKLIVISWMIIAILYSIAIMILLIIKSFNESYVFDGKISYSTLIEPVKKQPFNSVNQLNNRLTPFVGASNMTSLIESKNNEVDKMMEIFKRSMSDKDFPKLSKYIDKKSHEFISSVKKQEIKKLEFSLVVWSHCVGLLYNYVHSLFYKLQKFFVEWEELWEIEYDNHKENILFVFNEISNKSKSIFDLFTKTRFTDVKYKHGGMRRLIAWSGAMSELEVLSNLVRNESKVPRYSLPVRIEIRLVHYVDRWSHRLVILKKWVDEESDLFDWYNFLIEYKKIQKWLYELRPYLKSATDVNIPVEIINKGLKILIK